MHRHLTHLLINRRPLMPASSFTLLSPTSHLKSHLSLIMDPENASLLTNNISRSALIMHTKPPDAILPSGHTLSHPDNKTPSNRLSCTHIGISDRPPSLHSFYNYYSHYQYYIHDCHYHLDKGIDRRAHKKASGDTCVPPDERI